MNESLPYMVSSILFVALHVAGVILSLLFWNRCPGAAFKVLAGSLLNLLATITRVLLPMVWFRHFDDRTTFGYINTGITIVQIVAYGLILCAAFTGRNTSTQRPTRPWPRDDEEWDRPAAPPDKGSTGIWERPTP